MSERFWGVSLGIAGGGKVVVVVAVVVLVDGFTEAILFGWLVCDSKSWMLEGDNGFFLIEKIGFPIF